MISLYTMLDAQGFPDKITAIITGYDGDPFGIQRWKDADDALYKRHRKERREHNSLKAQIIKVQDEHEERQLHKEAIRRLKNEPVNDYWSAKKRCQDVYIVYPDDEAKKIQAGNLLAQFKKQRQQQMWERMEMKFSLGPNLIDHCLESGWVGIHIIRHYMYKDSLYNSFRKQTQERCKVKYGTYPDDYKLYDLVMPNHLYLSDLDPDLEISIPYEKGLITTSIQEFEDMFDTTKIPISRRNTYNTWLFDIKDLIEPMYEE